MYIQTLKLKLNFFSADHLCSSPVLVLILTHNSDETLLDATLPLWRGKKAPQCLLQKPCGTFGPSLGSRKGIDRSFQKQLLHPFPCINDSHNSQEWQEGGSYIYISASELRPFCLPPDSSHRKRCQLMAFRKFHIPPNNSEAFYTNSPAGMEDSGGGKGRGGERIRGCH